VGVWLFGWALLVGVARIAAALHHPSDILGSALLALSSPAWPGCLVARCFKGSRLLCVATSMGPRLRHRTPMAGRVRMISLRAHARTAC
jgi:hypothetical protein